LGGNKDSKKYYQHEHDDDNHDFEMGNEHRNGLNGTASFLSHESFILCRETANRKEETNDEK